MTFQRGTVVAILAIAITCGTALAAPAPAPAWLKFTHPELGFSVSYPEDWILAGGVAGVDFVALGPQVAGVQAMRLNVNITHDAVPAGTSVDVYHTKSEEVLKSTFTAYRLVRSARITIGTFPAVLRQYTWKRTDGIELFQLQLLTIDTTRGYVVTGTTLAGSSHLKGETKALATIMLTFRPRQPL